MARVAATVFAVIVAAAAHAQFLLPGTPHLLSDPDRFGGVTNGFGSIGSNGSEFLAVWVRSDHAFAARVDARGNVIDPTGVPLGLEHLSHGDAPAITSIGSDFVAAFNTTDGTSVLVALIDASGSVARTVDIGSPPNDYANLYGAWSSGRSIAVAVTGHEGPPYVRLLAADATPITPWIYLGPGYPFAICTGPDGYAMFSGASGSLQMRHISARGEISSPVALLTGMPPYLQRIGAAFDGRRYVVGLMWENELRAVLVAPDGAISPAIPIASADHTMLGIIIPTGGGSLVFYMTSDDYQLKTVAIDEASGTAGEPVLAGLRFVPNDRWTAVVGDLVLVGAPRTYPISRSTRKSAGEPFDIGHAALDQGGAVIASGSAVDLVVWTEGDQSVTLRATRVSRSGVALDKPPIDLGPPNGPPAVAYGRGKFLVAWSTGKQILARRIDEDGTVLDPVPIVVGDSGGLVRVAFGAGLFFLTFPGDNEILGARVTADGSVLDGVPIRLGPSDTTIYQYTAEVVFDGYRFIVPLTFTKRDTKRRISEWSASLVWVSQQGAATAIQQIQQFTPAFWYGGTLHFASNGSETLVVWSISTTVLAQRFDRAGQRIGPQNVIDANGLWNRPYTALPFRGAARVHGAWLLLFDRAAYFTVDEKGNLERRRMFALPWPDTVASSEGIAYTTMVGEVPFSGAWRVVYAPLDVVAAPELPVRRRAVRP